MDERKNGDQYIPGSQLPTSYAVCFQLTFLHPPVRATVGEVRYSIEIDVGGE